ncbi:MAG TPA: hypothetical protein VF164_01165 [Trueperaceae bacterium]
MTFSDGTFDANIWTPYTQSINTGQVTASRKATGGNPGACIEASFDCPGNNDQALLFYMYQNAVHDPATQGAILSVQRSTDVYLVTHTGSLGPGPFGVVVGVAAMQGGKLYFADDGVSGPETGEWRTVTGTSVSASSFRTLVDPNDHPDFTESGQPVTFGFFSQVITAGGSIQIIARLDNWQLELLTALPDVPALEAPVTVHLGESLNGVFADPSVDVSFFQNVDLEVGSVHELGDQLGGGSWYRFAIRDRSRQGGIIAYTGEALLTRLSRARPRESLVLVAGEGGVPNPLDLRECLARFLAFYGVPHDPDLPPFFLRTSSGLVVPTAQAFVIQPNQESPESIFEWLERFFGPFRGYTWRADELDRLVVRPPAWIETFGMRFHLYKATVFVNRTTLTYPWPWQEARAPTLEYTITVDGQTHMGTTEALTPGAPVQVVEGGLTFTITWAADGATLTVRLTDPSLFAPLFDAVFSAKPTGEAAAALTFTSADLGPDEAETSTADSVFNQAVIRVRKRTFEADQQLMQPAALILRSPTQLAAGLFGANTPYGPMAWAPDTPENFLELANEHGQSGTWFWPVADEIVIKPGGNVTLTLDIEEWAEQWRPESSTSTPHAAAANVNSYVEEVTLPASGAEVKLLDFQFPRQTSDFAPSPYGARGSLYGRWRGGDEPGVELRIANARFAEFGYLAESGIFGQTVYFLWGVQLKLNGSGIVWTVGPLETHRFGFARSDDGTWEGGAVVPGLAQSQALFPDRAYEAPELPYEVDAATALAIARGIVEENHVPKVVYQLPLVPAREDGYAYHPRHLGGAAIVQPLGVSGRITAHDYTESHSPAGSTSALTVDVEVGQALPDTPAAPTGRRYGRAVYGVTTYHPTEEA